MSQNNGTLSYALILFTAR